VSLDELAASLSAGARLVTDPEALQGYRQDQTSVVPGADPRAALLAATTEDVSSAVAWAARYHVPVVPRGAGSSLAGGASAVPGCLVVVTTSMRRIRELSPLDRLAEVEAGVVTADLDRAAGEHGLMHAPDPSSHETSTIGGNVATNAGGLRCVKYGVTRQSVLGLEVVLADGQVLRTGGRTTKDTAGYDLTGLFTGSEGTLGIITAATIRLRPRPTTEPVTLAAAFDTLAEAGRAVGDLVAAHLDLSMLELLDETTLRAVDDWKRLGLERVAAMLLVQCDGADASEVADRITSICDAAGAAYVAVADDAQEAGVLLAVRRLAYPAAERLGACLVEDVGVPVSRLTEMIERITHISDRYDVRILTVAHAGDGNLHPTLIFDRGEEIPGEVRRAAAEIFETALELGGTITGEHGVGVLKRDWLGRQLGTAGMEVTHRIKAALDPKGILNPGKLLPDVPAGHPKIS
jgi:glycolate oxidase